MVYKIPCQTCDAAYIGESGNRRRLKEHQNGVANGRTQLNALAEHHSVTSHVIAWDSARIIATEKMLSTRLLRESYHIQSTPHALNRTRGAMPTTYACTLQCSTQKRPSRFLFVCEQGTRTGPETSFVFTYGFYLFGECQFGTSHISFN